MAKEFGLGQLYDKFGFENEKKGIVPTKEMEERKI